LLDINLVFLINWKGQRRANEKFFEVIQTG